MSVGPRIVFVRFLTSDSPKIAPWVAHAERVVGSTSIVDDASEETGRVVWQLVSANNRELARGVEVHPTFESARAHASMVMELAPSLGVEHVSEAGRGVYGWYASVGERPVVTCARWYMSSRDRQHSIDLALRSIPIATLHSGARLTDPALMAGDRAQLV